jgi:hypothetical protein
MTLVAEPLPPAAEPEPTKLDARRVFIWQGRNPVAATNALADAIAECVPLFNVNDRLVLVDEGALTLMNLIALREAIGRYIVTRKIVNQVSADTPKFEVVHVPFEFSPVADLRIEPSEVVLKVLLGQKQPYRDDFPDNFAPLLARIPRA